MEINWCWCLSMMNSHARSNRGEKNHPRETKYRRRGSFYHHVYRAHRVMFARTTTGPREAGTARIDRSVATLRLGYMPIEHARWDSSLSLVVHVHCFCRRVSANHVVMFRESEESERDSKAEARTGYTQYEEGTFMPAQRYHQHGSYHAQESTSQQMTLKKHGLTVRLNNFLQN